jgi:hypothetical protein
MDSKGLLIREPAREKVAKMGGKELNRWPKVPKLNAKLGQIAEHTTQLQALDRELSSKRAELEQKLSNSDKLRKSLITLLRSRDKPESYSGSECRRLY